MPRLLVVLVALGVLALAVVGARQVLDPPVLPSCPTASAQVRVGEATVCIPVQR